MLDGQLDASHRRDGEEKLLLVELGLHQACHEVASCDAAIPEKRLQGRQPLAVCDSDIAKNLFVTG